MNNIERLVESGDVRECAACGQRSAYAWEHVTEKETYHRGCYERGEIAHIGSASCFERECGHCGANNVFAVAPILAECYTHEPPPEHSELPAHARFFRPAPDGERSRRKQSGRKRDDNRTQEDS
jgi:hypothetical protein